MKSTMWKTTRREIRQSLGRYLAILAIIALGVGFFAGLKVTKPTMLKITDKYLSEHAFFDYRLLCNYGFGQADVEAFAGLDEVAAAEGSVFCDVLYQYGEGVSDSVASVHSLTQQVNTLKLTAGRMPQAANECVVDSKLFTEAAIGQEIRISQDNTETTRELMTYDTYKIVGIAASPYYMNFERGSSSIGNGIVSAFIYIPLEGFTFDYYSEIYLRMDQDNEIYSQAYQDYIDGHNDQIEALLSERTKLRYESVTEDAQAEIDDAQAKLEDAQNTLDTESADALAELEDAAKQLADGQAVIEENRAELEDTQKQLEEAVPQLEAGIRQVQAGITQVSDGITQADDGIAQLSVGIEQLEEQILYVQQGELNAQLTLLQAQQGELNTQLTTLQAQRDELSAQLTSLQTQEADLSSQLEQAQEGLVQIAAGYTELEEAQAELDSNQADYEAGLEDYNTQIADGQAEIDENMQKLEDARTELTELEEPAYYMLDRTTNIGYECFESDSSIVEGIADVFPVFFFLVAALVCITTMNRMVEEQRTQIGVLKALGYSTGTIMMKYVVYSGSAAMIGCIAGFLAGSYLFPNVIWMVYGIMYTVGGHDYIIDLPLAVLSVLVSLLCSVGTTLISCRYELGSVAAELIRPKSPKSGKRILLERIPFIWKHLKFLHKVSIRNIFRYKKRFFMMVIGIGGCMALVLTGLGINDSIADVVLEQYDNIQTYDISVTLKDAPTQEEMTAFEEKLSGVVAVSQYYQGSSMELTFDGQTKSINVIVPNGTSRIGEFLQLFDKKGRTIAYPSEGEGVITQKYADKYGMHIGDEVVLYDGERNELRLKISGICSNYVYNYIYLTADTYTDQLGTEPEYKSVWCNVADGVDPHAAGTEIMNQKNVTNTSITEDMKERVGAMMSSLNYVVLLVIGCAAALAFIVLYNLTNINITERIREIATIKVLGFYPKETAAYVFRENMVLTVIGAIIGVPMGQWLHSFVMNNIDIDAVNFQIRILPVSYAYGFLLTLVFAMVVNFFMYFKLERINMAESLKSIE